MDVTPAIATIVAAFADDPVERWLYPEEAEYLEHFPRFVDGVRGEGTVSSVEDFAAVADLAAAGRRAGRRRDRRGATPRRSTPPSTRTRSRSRSRWTRRTRASRTGTCRGSPCGRSGRARGLGAALLREGLARVDADGLPAYLETPNPRTIPLYERHGFAVTAVAQAGECPPVTCMLRTARTAAAGG